MSQQNIEEKTLKCIRCGFCLDACPTFRLTGRETLSPRGRIYLIRSWHEGVIPINADVVEALDTCLGCRACETACPSGVEYGAILEMARAEIEERHKRSWLQAQARKQLVNMLAHPRLLAASLRAGALVSGAQSGKLPGFVAKLLSGKAETPVKMPQAHGAAQHLPPRSPAIGECRYRVGMLVGCVMQVLFANINAATVRVLQRNGCEVIVPAGLGCCGALHLHVGLLSEAKAYARDFLKTLAPVLDEIDAFVVNSAGCGSTLKEYGQLLADDAQYAEVAQRFAKKVRDVSEWLMEIGLSVPPNPLPITATYHDACHLAHAQRIRSQPRALLQHIPQLKLVELEEADTCCGSAGVYNITQPEMAKKLLDRKLEHIQATGAEYIVTGNPGCLAWIEQGVQDAGLNAKVCHPIELLDKAYS